MPGIKKNLRHSGAKVCSVVPPCLLQQAIKCLAETAWIALSGETRRWLLLRRSTSMKAASNFTSGDCHLWRGRRVRTIYGTPRAPCWAPTSLSQLAVGCSTTPTGQNMLLLIFPVSTSGVKLKSKTSFQIKEEWTQRDSNPRPPQCH